MLIFNQKKIVKLLNYINVFIFLYEYEGRYHKILIQSLNYYLLNKVVREPDLR